MKTLKHSRQRDSILECLMGRHDHPTADAICTDIREQLPNVSLGTVYRNLNLMVELGQVQKLSCGSGPDRFDANTHPHYHFVCRRCGQIQDLPMDIFPQLNEAAQEHCQGQIDSHTTYFYGTCEECLKNDLSGKSFEIS